MACSKGFGRLTSRFSIALLLTSLSTLGALEQRPWFGNPFEWIFKADYTYYRFSDVDNSICPLSSPSDNHLVRLDMLFSPPSWNTTAEAELIESPFQPFSWRSFALQAEKQWLDDIAGDPFSFATGANIRAVSTKSLRDVGCPYHANGNLELTASLGKEWSQGVFWTNRIYGVGAVGFGNRGSPWFRGLVSYGYNREDRHRLRLWAETYLGTGSQKEIDIDNFDGYGKIAHRSIDVGIGYAYFLRIWGSFHFEYARTVFARSFPERTNFFTFRYELPFSPF